MSQLNNGGVKGGGRGDFGRIEGAAGHYVFAHPAIYHSGTTLEGGGL